LTLKEKDQQKQPIIGSNYMAFMFDEIRYELNGAEMIDHNRNVGIISILKRYASFSSDNATIMNIAGLYL